jgi:hypothetical protein
LLYYAILFYKSCNADKKGTVSEINLLSAISDSML